MTHIKRLRSARPATSATGRNLCVFDRRKRWTRPGGHRQSWRAGHLRPAAVLGTRGVGPL